MNVRLGAEERSKSHGTVLALLWTVATVFGMLVNVVKA
jgi:hypothetical protein